MLIERFFAKSGTFEPYRMYTAEHLIMAMICFCVLAVALCFGRRANGQKVLIITRVCSCLLWMLEIIKIVFNIFSGNLEHPNSYIPLYFCSIPLYCSIMSGWGKGRIKRIGDVFLTVGGIVGGMAYILSPNTTAGIYPSFHFITFQSYILHCIMIYLSALYVITDYCKPKMRDIRYYALTVTTVCITAYIVNCFLESNLMFVSRNFPGTVMELIYNFSPTLFPFIMTFVQAVPPYLVVYGLIKLFRKLQIKTLPETEFHIYKTD